MLAKLSIKNIQKSIKDYAIYFFTLILGIAIFYVFNALGTQTAYLEVSSSTREIIKLMMNMLSAVSVFVSLVLGFLIIYASRFLMKRRNKEFGIYLTIGMSKRKVSGILFLETLLIGILSLVVGLGLGIVLSQLMSILVVNMFEADLTKFTFVLSSSACVKTAIYFGVMYLIVSIFNTVSVSKCSLIDLLHGSRVSEQQKLKSPILCTIVFAVAILVLTRAYYLVTAGFTELQSAEDILVPIIMGAVSTFFIFFSASGLILNIARKMHKVYYKGLNSFTLRQFSSKINTTVFSTSIICLMLFVTICLLSSCLTMSNSMNNGIQKFAPADIQLANYRNMNTEDNRGYYLARGYNETQLANSHIDTIEKLRLFGFDITDYLSDYITVDLYRTPDLTLNHTLGSRLEEVRTNYPFLIYDSMEPIIKLSDYNKVAEFYGRETYSLRSDEYIILADFKSMKEVRDEALKSGEKINLFGHVLKPKYTECQDGFIEMSSQRINSGIILVSDDVVRDEYLYQDMLIGNYKTSDKLEIRKLEASLDGLAKTSLSNEYLLPEGTTKLAIKESSNGLTAMVTFIGIYLGLIFLISSAAILGLKELSESSDNKERFIVLRKIGADEKLIDKALFRQIGIFFLLPVSLAIVHSIFGLKFSVKILEVFGTDELLPSIVMTAIFILLIYGGYFLITYYCSKNIIKERY